MGKRFQYMTVTVEELEIGGARQGFFNDGWEIVCISDNGTVELSREIYDGEIER